MDPAQRALAAFLEQYADETGDAAFLAGIAIIERACARARESLDFRWRSWPRGEMRAFRRSIKIGLLMCRFGVLTKEAEDERWDQRADAARLAEDLRARAARKAQRRRASS